MLVLGWHGGLRSDEATDRTGGYSTHDGAAVLVQDGNIVAGIEEERLNRISIRISSPFLVSGSVFSAPAPN